MGDAGHSVGKHPGASGSLRAIEPIWPAASSRLSSSRTRTSYPGTAFVGEPAFTGSIPSPTQFAAIGHPVSVCHQWSTTGTFSLSSAQWSVSGSQRSPARNSVRKRERSYFDM